MRNVLAQDNELFAALPLPQPQLRSVSVAAKPQQTSVTTQEPVNNGLPLNLTKYPQEPVVPPVLQTEAQAQAYLQQVIAKNARQKSQAQLPAIENQNQDRQKSNGHALAQPEVNTMSAKKLGSFRGSIYLGTKLG